MILSLQPIVDAIKFYEKENSKVILLTPSGKKYESHYTIELTEEKHLNFIGGDYEGFHERLNNYIHEPISIGDYVLPGGELPAPVTVDSIGRLIPHVIKNLVVSQLVLDTVPPQYYIYTKPIDFVGHKVPEVLIGGNHKSIEVFR